ncbi:uncharacterized protein N7459_004939 [Penicillium hispanicum]|uniref:uncharacterized protein n=1 Tax=Penicillium hispanicum TaxID=1080232 RepID=UPI002540033A|nr:uncharacterized protein N7459_004939 [Penicillium hispanicum]KAJ5585139.1 hypothetical protein N7459_004939 [Penicillium hispanicum]
MLGTYLALVLSILTPSMAFTGCTMDMETKDKYYYEFKFTCEDTITRMNASACLGDDEGKLVKKGNGNAFGEWLCRDCYIYNQPIEFSAIDRYGLMMCNCAQESDWGSSAWNSMTISSLFTELAATESPSGGLTLTCGDSTAHPSQYTTITTHTTTSSTTSSTSTSTSSSSSSSRTPTPTPTPTTPRVTPKTGTRPATRTAGKTSTRTPSRSGTRTPRFTTKPASAFTVWPGATSSGTPIAVKRVRRY